MANYSKNEIILVRYPFSDLSSYKVRPAVIVSVSYSFQDIFITPLTSKITSLLAGEFILSDWQNVGLNVPTAVKRGIYTIHYTLIIKKIGQLINADAEQLKQSLQYWLDL